MNTSKVGVKTSLIERRIPLVRGEKVIIDADLAEFYGVATKRLNEQVGRNPGRFPEDFVLRLTRVEKAEVVAKCDHLQKLKYSKGLPHAFTEHGALMAASVLNSTRAVEVSVFVVRAFVRLRETIGRSAELARKLSQLERHLADHDHQILSLVAAIRQMTAPSPAPATRRIGFTEGRRA